MVLVLAHRGLHDTARENTVAAFRAATAGADGVELDVRLAADGTLAVLHDPEVAGVGPLRRLTAAELPPWLPTLDAALDACAGQRLVNVELKADTDGPGGHQALATAAASCLLARPEGGPELLVSSFDLDLLGAHRRAAGIATGWLVLPGVDDPVSRAAGSGHTALHPHFSMVTPELVGRAHAEGLRVVTWTVNEGQDARRLVEAGVDVLISDKPTEVREELSGSSGS